MIRRPPRSTLFPTRRSSDLRAFGSSRRAWRPADRAAERRAPQRVPPRGTTDRKSTRLNSSHVEISYAVFCLKKKKKKQILIPLPRPTLRRDYSSTTHSVLRL